MSERRLLADTGTGTITLGEGLVLGATSAVAVVGIAALATAQVGVFSVAAVLGVSLVALVVLGVAVRRLGFAVNVDRVELLWLLVVAVVAAVMFFPGFPYAYADKDPGVYVAHSHAIAREGSVTFEDPILEEAEDVPGVLFAPGARFPGIWVDDGTTIEPQFFHYFPALLAVASELAGQGAVFHVNPLVGVLSVLAVGLVARRLAGHAAGAIAGVVLAVSMSQVWQAKYPGSEVLAQAFFFGSLLAVVLSMRTGSRSAALLGGFLVTTGFLNRPDGLLIVLLAVGLGAVIITMDRVDGRFWAFAAGAAVPLPYAFLNAFHIRADYTFANDVPGGQVVAVLIVAVLGCAVVLRAVTHRSTALGGLVRTLTDPSPRLQLVAGGLFTVGYAVMLVLFWYRERLFGIAFTDLLGPEPSRSLDEINLRRLAYYTTITALPLSVAGVGLLTTRPWRVERWVVVLPGVALLGVYLAEAQISPRLMWWVRRFVPTAVPFLVIAGAVAIAWLLTRRQLWWQAGGVVMLLWLLGNHLERSWPLRDHREFANSYATAQTIADVSGDEQGLFLWERPSRGIFDPSRNLGAVVWFSHDQLSVLLPEPVTESVLQTYAERFPDHPVYLVTHEQDPTAWLDRGQLTVVEEIDTTFPLWDEALTQLPRAPKLLEVDLTVWRYRPFEER